MKKITLISVFLLFLNVVNNAQTSSAKNDGVGKTATTKDGKQFKVKWQTDPFNDHVFVENNGQFDGRIKSGDKILYGANLGMVDIYFTSNKIIYRYDKDYYKKSSNKHADADDPKLERHEVYFLKAEWQDANSDVSIVPKDELKAYYTYTSLKNKAIKANGYGEIIYKNLYPGVDATFQFREGKAGLKYSLIVHPGADLSKIKINYSGAKNISKNSDGDIVINSGIDLLTEHAPVTNYLGTPGSIAFSNVITGTTESFKADENYDKSKTIVIDPWITDPLFPSTDKAYDMTWDYHGNVYVYGGSGHPWQLVKMNNLGVIQWTYLASPIPGDYGCFTTDKVTGTSYLCQGFSSGQVLKVNTNGVYLATFPGDPADLDELWRAKFDPCNRNIVIAGGGTGGDFQAAVLDTNMLSFVDTVNILGATGPFHDMALIAIDPDGNHCYIASARSFSYDPTHFDNMLMQMPLPSLRPTNYELHENCHFVEVNSVHYVATETNGMNGAAASPDWVYLYNGDTLRRYHKNSGLYTNSYAVSPNTPFQYGGLDVDPCDNLYMGVRDSIYVVDSTYTLYTKIPLPNTVFDVQLGQSGALYACGVGFVTQITNPVTPTLISSATGTPSSCSSCNGTATVNVNCGIAPFSFHWSNGNTTQTSTGLCVGVYTVTVTDGSCPPRVDSTTVIINGLAGYSANITDTNPGCPYITGNSTAFPYGGNAPYTYSWSNGQTNQKDTGLSAGTYTLTITDNIGCKAFVVVTLVNATTPTVTVAPPIDSVCIGAGVGLVASGASTYTWLPLGSGLSCYNCPNPTASPTSTTTYTVVGKDGAGCVDQQTVTIKIKPTPRPSITGPDTTCVGGTVTLSASGGGTYQWSPGGATTTSITIIASSTQTYTLQASNGICLADTTFLLTVVPPPTVSITTSKDSLCKGDTLTLMGRQGLKYKWKPGGQTTSVIHVSQNTTTTYWFYSYVGTCVDSNSITIPTIPDVTATISTNLDSICPGQSAKITVTPAGGAATYSWSPGGATSSSITVMPASTMSYTATVTGECNTFTLIQPITVVPFPQPVIQGTNWKCRGVRDTLVASNLNGPATYVWSNGSTATSIKTGPIDGDSSVTLTAYNKLGCPHDTTFFITLRSPLGVTVPPPAIFCAGSLVCISATISGSPTNPVSYSWTPGGGSTDTICVSPTDTTTYIVTVSNGCKSTRATTLTPNYPNLYSCCSQTISIVDDTVTPGKVILSASGNSKTYQWDPATTVTCLNPRCDSVKLNPTPSVTTTYTITGTDSNGCSISQLITITVDVPCFNLIIPNVFTPTNGGSLGLDKVFYINARNMDAWTITIFDRWGKQVFNSTDTYDYWTGNTPSGGAAPAGVYYYVISGTCQGTTYKRDGYVQVIR